MNDWQELGNSGRCLPHPSPPARLAAVFVHGFQGDELETWTYQAKRFGFLPRGKPVVLFDLLENDRKLPACDFYSLRHRGGITSPTDIDLAAGALETLIRTYIPEEQPVALIAHSFGGLACRQAILNLLEDPRQRFHIAGLMMFGTPNNGTEIARAAKALGSAAAADMTPFNDALAELNREWAERIVNGGDPDSDPAQRAQLLCRYVVGSEDKVVKPSSAATLASFAELEVLSCGHVALVKPWNRDHPAYKLIAGFLRQVEEASARSTGERALRELTTRLRRVSLGQRRELGDDRRPGLAGRWVRREEERIRLDEGEESSWLECRVRNRRWGGLAQRRFEICVFLTGQQPELEIDFSWEIGRGNLGEREFADLGQRVSGLFDVGKLTVTQGGKEVEYRPCEPIVEAGWTLMAFEAASAIEEERPYELLELEFATVVDRGQGWYIYQLDRTVAERLELVFEAPFKVQYIDFLGGGAKFEGPTPSGSHYLHRASVDRALPIGRGVVWVYPREKEDGRGIERPEA